MKTCDIHLAPDYANAALLTIDVQNDTLDGAAFQIPGTTAVLPNIRQLCRTFRRIGRPIIHVIRIYTADAADADRCRRSALLSGHEILLKGTVGHRPADELLPDPDIPIDDELLLRGAFQTIGPNEVIMFKPRWGAFFRTPLDGFLDEKKISTLIVAGSNYPNCPRTSIMEASERDFRICAAVDAISGITPPDVDWLESIGVICATTEDACRCIHRAEENKD